MSLHIQNDKTEEKVQPTCPKCGATAEHKCETQIKDGPTELLSSGDQSQQSSSTAGPSNTNLTDTEPTSMSREHVKNDEGNKAQNETEKASAYSVEEKKCESISANGTEQLTNTAVGSSAECSSMKVNDQSESVSQDEVEQKDSAAEQLVSEKCEGFELAAEPMASGEIRAEQHTDSVVADEVASSTGQLQPETVMNSENKLEQLNENALSAAHTDADSSTDAAALPSETKPDATEAEVVKEQSEDPNASVEVTATEFAELSPISVASIEENHIREISVSDLDIERTALPSETKPDATEAEVVKEQSEDTVASVEVIATELVEESPISVATIEENHIREISVSDLDTQRAAQTADKKHAKQAQSLTKSEVKKDRNIEHSQQVEKDRTYDKRTRRRGEDRERTSPIITRSHSMQHGTEYWGHLSRVHYQQDENYSHHDRFTQQESKKMKRHDSGDYRRTKTEMKRKDYDFDDISSDEETGRYKGDENYCCWFCSKTYKTILSLLQHLEDTGHEQVSVV